MSENQIKSNENNVKDALLNHLANEDSEENFEVSIKLIN